MLKNTFISLNGATIAQAIGFAFLPFLTRAYTPENFATYQVYMSLLMIITIISAMRYEVALLNAKKGKEVRTVLNLCLWLNLIFSTLVLAVASLALLPGEFLIASFISSLPLAALCVGVLLGGLAQTFLYVTLRESALGTTAIAKILQVLVFCTTALVIVKFWPSDSGLIISDIGGRFAVVIFLLGWVFYYHRHLFAIAPFSNLKTIAIKYRKYPFYSVPGGLLTAAMGAMLPLIMLTAFGKSTMGQYSLVERSVMMPVGLLAQSVAHAFTANLSSALVEGREMLPTFRKLVLFMGGLGLIPALILFFMGQSIFEIFFGMQWSFAGQMAQISGLLLVSNLAVTPVNMTLLLLRKQKVQLSWELARLVLVGTLWTAIFYFKLSPLVAIGMHVGLLSLVNIIFLYLVDTELRQYDSPAKQLDVAI